MSRSRIKIVALSAAALVSAVALAGSPPPVAEPTAWSKPVNGLALGLVMGSGPLREEADPDRDHSAGLRLHVFVKNVSKRPVKVLVPVLPAGLDCVIEQRGTRTRFGPTFYPPPMPRPGDRPRPHTLSPGRSLLYATIDSVSGHTETARPKARWYRVLPAGRYAVRVTGTIGGVKGRFSSPPVALRVLRADQPVDGLQIAVEADRLRTRVRPDGRDIEPIKLRVTFRNVGRGPLGLDLYELPRRGLRLEINGPSTSQADARPGKTRPAVAADRPTLKPGQRLAKGSLSFPGDFGGKIYQLDRPGWYQLRLSYEQREAARCGSLKCWTGKVNANLLWLEILPSRAGTSGPTAP